MRTFTREQFISAVLSVIESDEYLRRAHHGHNAETMRQRVKAFGDHFDSHGKSIPPTAPPPTIKRRKKKKPESDSVVDM